MKNYFILMNKQQGFIFPYLLFIISIIILITFHQLANHQNQALSFKLELEQYQLESLHYFAYNYIQANKDDFLSEETLIYPNGKITIIEKERRNNQSVYDVKTETSQGSSRNYLIKIDNH
ncbi:hypothetical protein [Saliterribacillus persicus]|uniref:Competence protein ComGG n=1 Tax=Saliterribacillus persicus TaxID=930114 RepID=A0A368XCE8_9BACI|nr:hypothetical protein [Saliterribacillus persicus]RCW65379.1 hypothetical protein DFR57_111114 [Saliterribacillus persicus]